MSGRFVLAFASALGAAFGGGVGTLRAQDGDLAVLVQRLAATGPERNAAYLDLHRRRDPRVIPLLVQALPGFDAGAQSLGVHVLEAFRDDASQRALAGLARSAAAPKLRLHCAAVLFRQGRAEFLPVILAALREPALDDSLRVQMLSHLHGIEAPEIAALVRGWIEPERTPFLLRAAISHLGAVRDAGSRAAFERVADADGVPLSLRALAVANLLALGHLEREPLLVQAIREDAVEPVDWHRIGQALQSRAQLSEALLQACTARLESPSDAATVRVALQLAERFRHRGAVPAARALLAHDDPQIARAALQFLLAQPGALSADGLRPLLARDDPEGVLRVAEALIRMDDPSGFPPVLALARETGHAQRVAALRLLGRFRQRAAVPHLLDALEDPDFAVRQAAEPALQTLLGSLHPYRRLDVGSTGYAAGASAADRERAVRTLRAWWEANR